MASNGTALCESGWRNSDTIIHFEHDCAVPVLAQAIINWTAFAMGLIQIFVFAANMVLLIWQGAAKKRQMDLGLCTAFVATGYMAVGMSLTDHSPFIHPGLFVLQITSTSIFAFGIVPLFFFSELIQDTFECLLALDPRAKESVYTTVRRTILPTTCGSAILILGLLGCYLAEGEKVYLGVAAWCIGLGIWCAGTAFLLLKTALRLRQMPPSARAYLEEYPKQRQAMQKLQAVCLLLGTTILLSAAMCIFVLTFLRRWFGMAIATFMVTSLPGGILFGGYMFRESWIGPSHGRRLATIEPIKTTVSPVLPTKLPTLENSHPHFRLHLDLARCGTPSTIRGLLRSIPALTQIRGAMRGLSIEFLDIFYEEFDISARETTYEVCQRVIVPLTKPHRCTFSDLLSKALEVHSSRALPVPASGDIWQGEHTVFVSHTWGKPFYNLILTIKQFVQMNPSREKDLFYLDIFGLNQHQLADEKKNATALGIDLPPSKPDDDAMLPEIVTELTSSHTAIPVKKIVSTQSSVLNSLNMNIKSVTTMLVAINKWDDPAPLSRIWCLYEVWQAVRYKIPLVMGFSGKEAERFCKAVESFEMCLDETIPALVDISKAQATVQSDLTMIRSAINGGIGMRALNGILRQKLMAHLVRSHVQLSKSVSRGIRRVKRQSLWRK